MTKKIYAPLKDTVYLKEIKRTEQQTDAGLVLDERSRTLDDPQYEVVAVGPGRRTEDGRGNVPVDLERGQRVVLLRMAIPNRMDVDGEAITIVKETDIACVVG
jgi:chaperonin GroES